jgi:hypothetical protein
MKQQPFKYAVGTTSQGITVTQEFVFFVALGNRDLVELYVPEGASIVRCAYNNLKELNLPESVNRLECDKGLIDITTTTIKGVEIHYK